MARLKERPQIGAGRPSEYEDKYCKMIEEYFDVPLYKKQMKQVVNNGKVVEVEVEVANSLPTFAGFSRLIRIPPKTILEWTTKHEKFRKSYELCRSIQEQFLVEHGVLGNYSSNFAKFVAINYTGLKDQTTEAVKDLAGALKLKYSNED